MKKLFLIVIFIAAGGGLFYAGMKYGQRNNLANFSPRNFQGSSSEESQQFLEGNIREGFREGFNREDDSKSLRGKVVNKDEQSLTLEIMDGSSVIIFFSDSTAISKMTDGSVNDIEIGRQITINGEQNADGSYSAKTIQLSSF